MANNFRKPYRPVQKQRAHKINEEIKCPSVRVTGDGVVSQVLDIAEALKLAREMEVDLVEINPNSVPPVCKLIEYSKLVYEEKKKKKDNKKHQVQVEVKEMRLTPTTDEHDLQFKVNHAINWLKEGNKVKAVVVFKGRMITHKETGQILLLKLAQMLEGYGKAESMPSLEGFKMMMIFSAVKKK
jgi:translation initiation factor IF-3